MATEVIMPKVDMDMTHGIIVAWRVAEGQAVKKGDALFDIETDKAAMEVESPASGTVHNLVAENVEVAIGKPVAFIYAAGESILASAETPASVVVSALPDRSPSINQPASSITKTDIYTPFNRLDEHRAAMDNGSHDKPRASPVARRIARNNSIDLTLISGSGPKGRIMRKDVEAQLAASTANMANPAAGTSPKEGHSQLIPHSRMRKVIAQRLQESKRDSPHFYLTIDCRVDDFLESRRQINDSLPDGVKVSINDMLVMAAAKALRAVPDVNASWKEEHIEIFTNANIAIAVAINGGLVTPVIQDAGNLSLSDISSSSAALAQRARDGELNRDDLAGGTFTISNLGMFGIREFAAVINPPQAAILAVGACEKRAVVHGESLEIVTMMTVTLSCDHRVVDGAVGARWLQIFKGFVETPFSMSL